MNLTAPTIETPRLILRHHSKNDFNDMVTLWSHPTTFKFIGGLVSTPQQTWARLLTCVGHWAVMGFGYWVVQEKLTGQFAGQIGFADYKRGIKDIEGLPELGWAITPSLHQKGYATEGVKAALEWADSHLQTKTCCIISPGNAISIKVAQKFGFKNISQVEYGKDQTLVFHRDFESSHG